jgi:hypothetical protein
MATYLVLIYGDEQRWERESPAERRGKGAAHAAFAAAVGSAGGTVLGSGELAHSGTATSLRAGPGDRPLVTDGPFMETKEMVGGFYLLEVADLPEAISLAGRLPEVSAGHGGVEIRPVR